MVGSSSGSTSSSSSGNGDSSKTDASFSSEFEALLLERNNDVRPGKVVRGRVAAIGREVVTVDIGFKSEGVVPREQFPHIEGKISCLIGEEVDVFIIAFENELGQVVLSKEKADQMKVWQSVEDVYKAQDKLRGVVTQKVKGGLQVDIGIPAFLPGSQIDIRPHRNLDKFIGQEFEFKVLKVTRDKGNIVLSRRALLVSERDQLRTATLKVLQEGVVMEGVVKNVTDYGAFIDLGGIDGLLHITDISWSRINHPSEKLSVGQSIPVVVLKYDGEKERVSLGMKQLTPDPWLTVHERYPRGGRVKGKVKSLTDYGAFVELEEGVEGLVHVSEMTWAKKPRHPSKVFAEGQTIEAVILGIDTEQQRIGLGTKQLMANPWEELEMRHPVNSIVEGKVRSITEFGIFIGVEDGIDGLVHVSDLSWTKRITDPKELQDLYKKGDDVKAIVLGIDVANERLSLGIKQLSDDPWAMIPQRYPVGTRIKGIITRHADYGVFVGIENGLEGLIHTSQLWLEQGQDMATAYKAGEQCEAEVVNIDSNERKVSLSTRALKEREHKPDRYQSDYSGGGEAKVTFAELMKGKFDPAAR